MTEPKAAAAVRYLWGDQAPVLTAKARGGAADHLVAIARNHGILIHEDAELNRDLMSLETETWIPERHFRILAQILRFAYSLKDGDA